MKRSQVKIIQILCLDVFGTVFLEEPQEMVLNGVLLMLEDGEKPLVMVAMDVTEILVLAWIAANAMI